jgi:hypothetical protein
MPVNRLSRSAGGEIEPAGEGEENWHVIKDLYVAFAAAKV